MVTTSPMYIHNIYHHNDIFNINNISSQCHQHQPHLISMWFSTLSINPKLKETKQILHHRNHNSEDRNISLTNTKSWAKNITTHKPSQHIISTINLSNIFNAIDQQSKNIQVPFPNPHSFKQPYIINIQPHTTAFALQASQTRKHVLWLTMHHKTNSIIH